jgi:hypothetical protein
MTGDGARVRVFAADDHLLFREAVVRATKERPERGRIAAQSR